MWRNGVAIKCVQSLCYGLDLLQWRRGISLGREHLDGVGLWSHGESWMGMDTFPLLKLAPFPFLLSKYYTSMELKHRSLSVHQQLNAPMPVRITDDPNMLVVGF
jgi:hypothetical protein